MWEHGIPHAVFLGLMVLSECYMKGDRNGYIPGGQGWIIGRLVDSVGDLDFTISWTEDC